MGERKERGKNEGESRSHRTKGKAYLWTLKRNAFVGVEEKKEGGGEKARSRDGWEQLFQ